MARYFVEQGAKEVVAIDVSQKMIEQAKKSDYNNIGQRQLDWNVEGVVKYHRNFETIVNNIVNAKMSIIEIQESKACKNAIKLVPKYVYQKDRPYFLFVKAIKTR